MSSRSSESYIVAIDVHGESHFVAYDYSYSGGYYHNFIQLGKSTYEISSGGDGVYIDEKGQKLPYLESKDISSFFTEELTQTMRKAAALANLMSHNITYFLFITVCYAGRGILEINCATISDAGNKEQQFVLDGVPDEIFGESVEDIAADILEKGVDGYAAYLESVRKK